MDVTNEHRQNEGMKIRRVCPGEDSSLRLLNDALNGALNPPSKFERICNAIYNVIRYTILGFAGLCTLGALLNGLFSAGPIGIAIGVVLIVIASIWFVGKQKEKAKWARLRSFVEQHTFPEIWSFVQDNSGVYGDCFECASPVYDCLRKNYLDYLKKASEWDYIKFCVGLWARYHSRPLFGINLVSIAEERGFNTVTLLLKRRDPSTPEWREEQNRIEREQLEGIERHKEQVKREQLEERKKQEEEKKRQFAIRFIDCATVKDGIDYEKFIAGMLRREGIEPELTKATGDFGADIIATYSGMKIAIQCKFWKSNNVGYDAVQQVYTAKDFFHCQRACVVSNANYTPQAIEGASRLGVGLLHHRDVVSYIKSGTGGEQMD